METTVGKVKEAVLQAGAVTYLTHGPSRLWRISSMGTEAEIQRGHQLQGREHGARTVSHVSRTGSVASFFILLKTSMLYCLYYLWLTHTLTRWSPSLKINFGCFILSYNAFRILTFLRSLTFQNSINISIFNDLSNDIYYA